ncbi:MAG: hypothetical protein ONB55_21895 [candidate division KSB1 bacterium]|nr:hypothetical protein [candidate division KSB1 bacterium]
MYAIAVKRGCGTRKKGGVYWEVGLSPGGLPLEYFLIDPPTPLPEEYEEMSRQGVTTHITPDGVTHVLDWVGEQYYPNVCDFVEEVRRFGLSRRIPKNFDFTLITDKSRILLIHHKAIIDNWLDYAAPEKCPKDRPNHLPLQQAIVGAANTGKHDPRQFCIGYWSMDIEGGEYLVKADGDPENDSIWWEVSRQMPSFSYYGFAKPPAWPLSPSYTPGIFASFPCGRLVVVADDDNSHQETFEKMQQAGVPSEVVEQ